MVENPILFITFVRPEYARKSWDAIKAAQPKKLYFYSNKGRAGKEGEIEKNEEIRSFIKEIDWECDLHTWFRKETVNVYDSLQGAISWLFENEEQGIILEEDCVASLAFFDFCDKLLPYYKEDYRIWMISGDNYFENEDIGQFDYFFSQDMQIYGWASWRSRWRKMDWESGLDVDRIISEKIVNSTFRTKLKKKMYLRMLRQNRDFIIKTKCWDYTFLNYGVMNNSLAVVPAYNLVENIGLEGHHNKQIKKQLWNVEVTYNENVYNIGRKPPFISPNMKYEEIVLKQLSRKSYSLPYRIINKIKRIWGRFWNKE